ncbi:MAG: potassium channel family protein [Salibacteraceae bacterium]
MIGLLDQIPSTYKTSIIDQPFMIDHQVLSKQTIAVSFIDANGNIVASQDYALLTEEDIYQRLLSDTEVDFNHCYVSGLSLSTFRMRQNMENTDPVILRNFNAHRAFFESDSTTDFSGAEFQGNVQFDNATFGSGHINFNKCLFKEGDVDFSRVYFGKGSVDFRFAEFGKGTATFESAIFQGGNVFFVNALFKEGKVSFRNTNFGTGDTDFHFSRFRKGGISFDKAVFRGKRINFGKCEFGEGKADFRRCDFGDGEVIFSESEFGKGKINFTSTLYGRGAVFFDRVDFGPNEVLFERATFGQGKLSFLRAKAKRITLTAATLNGYADLRVAKAQVIDLSYAVVRDLVDFQPGEAAVDVKLLYLKRMRNLGRLNLDYQLNGIDRLIGEQPDTTAAQKAEQYRLLKEDLRTSGQYIDEDKVYVLFKRSELKAWKEQKLKERSLNALWVYPSMGFQWLVFDKMGLFATDPLRVLSSSIFVYIVFSILYVLVILGGGGDIVASVPDEVSLVGKSFYHSAITFLTIGYGDHFPQGHVRWISSVEGWIGLFLMSYFTVAFVRKILR